MVLCHGFPHLWFSWHRQITALATDSRVKESALETLLMREHAQDWTRYLESGEVAGMDEILANEEDEAPARGPFDGLLLDPVDMMSFASEPGEEDNPEEDYGPLPGFEDVG